MQVVSEAIKNYVDDLGRIGISLMVDGAEAQVEIGSMSYSASSGGAGSFRIGGACSASAALTVTGAGLALEGKPAKLQWEALGEPHPLITGKIYDVRTSGGDTSFVIRDAMHSAGSVQYVPSAAVQVECTADQALTDIARQMGVEVAPGTLALAAAVTLKSIGAASLNGKTLMTAAGQIAALMGGNAVIDRTGKLAVVTPADTGYEIDPYIGGDSVKPTSYTVTGVSFVQTSSSGDAVEYTAGTGPQMLRIENDLADDELAANAFAAVSNLRFYGGDFELPGGLLLEPSDMLSVLTPAGTFPILISQIQLDYDGGVRASVSSVGFDQYNGGGTGQMNQQIQKMTKRVSDITKTVNSITLEVTNGLPGNTAKIALKVGDTEYSGTIDLTGLVTFTNLESSGQTTINGGNITAGKIQSKDGNCVIDLDNGTSTLTSPVTAAFDDYSGTDAMWAKVKSYLISEIIKMKEGRVKNYVFAFDASNMPEVTLVYLHRFHNDNNESAAVAIFIGSDGSIGTMNGYDEGANDSAWFLNPLTWTVTTPDTPGPELTESWESLRIRVRNGDFSGIHIGDRKAITLTTGETVVMEVAGIDTYYRCGDTEIGHHVDFISRDCLKTPIAYRDADNNNGTQAEPSPYLASNLPRELDKVYTKLPADLRACIIPKRMLLEHRYSSAGIVIAPTGWGWHDMGKLWLPTETEVWGTTHWSQPGFGSGADRQYPIFAGSSEHLIKGADGARCSWWVASARDGNFTDCCCVGEDGSANCHDATNADVYAPLCFRIG